MFGITINILMNVFASAKILRKYGIERDGNGDGHHAFGCLS